MIKPKKVERSCENCITKERLPQYCKTYGTVCSRWLYKKASCKWCTHLRACYDLGKELEPDGVCINFKKRAKAWNPRVWELIEESQGKTPESKAIKLNKDKKKDEQDEEFNSVKLVEDIIESDYDPRAMALVDDRDIPRAGNPITFLTGSQFLGITPFPRQLQIASEFWSAYCPYCSDTKFIRTGIQVDTKLDEIYDRMVLYHNGVCPKCGKTRAEAIFAGDLNQYNRLVGCAGQRCVTGDTLILCDRGLIYMESIAETQSKRLGFSKYDGPNVVLENGMIVQPTKFYRSSKETLRKILFSTGSCIKGTNEHPILTLNGFVKLKDLKKGDVVPVTVGQNSWGLHPLNFKPFNKEVCQQYTKWVNSDSAKRCKNLTVKPNILVDTVDADIAKLLGFWVAEGYKNRISNTDVAVKEFCKQQFHRIYGKNSTIVNDTEVKLRFMFNVNHFDLLLDSQIQNKCTSEYKFIPPHILTSPKDVVGGFLQGLFEGDGYVSKGYRIEYTTISHKLVSEVQHVLANFGIISRIKSFQTWATNGSENQVSKTGYTLYIEGPRNLKLFKKYIDFFSQKKKARLNEGLAAYENRCLDMPFWYEKFPYEVKREYISILDSINEYLHKYQYSNKNKAKYPGYGLLQALSISSIFGINSEIGRIYSDNVALSKRRLHSTNKILKSSKWWAILPLNLRTQWSNFYERYCDENTFFMTVTSNRKIGKDYTYDFHIPEHHRFIGNGIVNHNSGKSVFVAMIAAVHTYQYLILPDIHSMFGLLPSVVLHGTFVGLRYTDAYQNLWEPYLDNVTNTPWFKEYIAFLKQEGNRIGKELVKINDSSIAWTLKRMAWAPFGPDKRMLRGRTRIFAAGDEVGWFFGAGEGVKYNWDEIQKALGNSLMTIRPKARQLLSDYPDIPTAIECNISSPSSKLDPIMRAYKQSQGSKVTFGWKYPTWEVNPNIKKEDLAEEYRVSPIEAERDFGANPPFSTAPYIKSPAALVPLFKKSWKNTLSIRGLRNTKDSLGSVIQYPVIEIRNPVDAPCCLSIDCGYSNNSFALTINHWVQEDNGERKLATSGVLEIIPDPNPLDYVGIYRNVITPIINNFDVRLVAFDRWQSLNLAQQVFQDFNIDAVQYSVNMDDFEEMRARIYSGEWLFAGLETPVDELIELNKSLDELINRKPMSHLFLQFLTSKDTGRIITKGDETTDDILRACILGTAVMLDEDYASLFDGSATNMKRKYIGMSLGSLAYRTIGGGASSGHIPGIARMATVNLFGRR